MFASRFFWSVALAGLLTLGIAGCGGGGGTSTPPVPSIPLTITLVSSTLVVPQDGAAANLPVTVTGPTTSYVLKVTGVPFGMAQSPLGGSGPAGSLNFTGSPLAAAGSYPATISVTMAGQTKSATVVLVSAPVITLGSAFDTTLGQDGKMSQAMATSFQPAEWDDAFFVTNGSAKTEALAAMAPQFLRIQGLSRGVPMRGNTGAASDWDFSTIDKVVQPVLPVASLEFQVAVAPAWMCDSAGRLDIPNHLNDFAAYAANLVRYYNKGGFDWGGQHFLSPLAGKHTIHWWGVFNEYNINGVSAADYVKIYNAVVPAMLAADSTIQFSALEFSDFGLGTGNAGDPRQFLPTFFAAAADGGVNAQVDVVSTHFYSTCNQKAPDTSLFASVPGFADNVRYFYEQVKTRPDLSAVPVWVTENNVNADFSNNGMSACNAGQPFVTDTRGSSAFFAAWRPYVFSQLAKAGNQAIFHWDYDADAQFGEVDYRTGKPYLSYWVDQYLARAYVPGTTAGILKTDVTQAADLEVLATEATNTGVQVMIANHSVHTATDNNGAGNPRTVVVDFSKANLPYRSTLTTAGLTIFDVNTSVTTGATATQVPYADRIVVTLNGYGTAFLGVGP